MSSRPLILVVMVIIGFTTISIAAADTAGDATYPPIPPVPTNHPEIVVVNPGDHLWKLSAEHLADRFDRDVANSEIAPYWLETIEANRDRLRSGNPDLIFPGEEVLLPASELP